MARTIFEVNATQVVVSESHPEGVRSVVPGYPILFDSMNYNNSEELALTVARAEFWDRVKQLSLANNRAMWTVTIIRADGQMIDKVTFGSFPVIEPEPTPEPEPEET